MALNKRINDNKDKITNSVISYIQKRKKRERGRMRCSELVFFYFRERVCNLSLRFQEIGLSDFVEPRSKAVLRSKGFAWAPILRSFDKLHDVRVLSYLSYTLFKCFVDD